MSLKTVAVFFLAFALTSLTSGKSLQPVSGECDEWEQECPNGCCPNAGWVCCSNGQECAAVESECDDTESVLDARPLKSAEEDCNGTLCPGGCCPENDWICCPDNKFCAPDFLTCPPAISLLK